MLTIACIGLGKMGGGMAANLLKAGHAVRGFDVRSEAYRDLEQANFTGCKSAGEAVEGSPCILLSLTSTELVRRVLFADIGKEALAGKAVIDTSTISPEAAIAIAGEVKECGGDYLDAPVTGGVPGAHEGKLIFIVGGDPTVVEKVKPVFDACGSHTGYIGPSGHGQAAKAVNQLAFCARVAGVCEAVYYTRHYGVSLQAIQDCYRSKNDHWLDRLLNSAMAYEKTGKLAPFADDHPTRLFEKDLRMMLEGGQHLPITETLHTIYRTLVDEEIDGCTPLGIMRAIEHISKEATAAQG